MQNALKQDAILCGVPENINGLSPKTSPKQHKEPPHMTSATINNPYLDTLKTLLGKEVLVIVDRPYGSVHPKHPNIHYSVNYGYIELMKAPDGECQDAYILGINEPLESYKGIVIAIIQTEAQSWDGILPTDNGGVIVGTTSFPMIKNGVQRNICNARTQF